MGSGSPMRSSQFITMSAAHSLGQERVRRPLQHREVVEQVAEPLRPRQLLRPDEPQQEHHAADRADRHQR